MTQEDLVRPESRSKNLRIFLLLATLLVIALTIALTLKSKLEITPEIAPEITPKITQESLQQEIQALQNKLPIKVDAHTELKGVATQGMQIIYSFVVMDDPTNLSGLSVKDDNFPQQVEISVKANACLNKNTRRYINSNVSLSYRYLDKDNATLAAFVIPASFCNQ